MNNKTIIWLSDFTILGSGYKNITVPMCVGLAERGYNVKVLGFNYMMEEHHFPFSVIPANPDPNILMGMLSNLNELYEFDHFVCALDIPWQKKVMNVANQVKDAHFKTSCITAVESIPLSNSFGMVLANMDQPFIISRFGTKEAVDKGIDAKYFPVGIDTESWRVPTHEETNMLRSSFGIGKDTFVILTVADNQERKFLSRTAQIIRDFKNKNSVDVRWILVTRPKAEIGWNLTDLVSDMGLASNYLEIERGISFKELWGFYAMSDVFLLTSKAEGLGMPVIEAMATGLPVVATDCTGLGESIRQGGGFLIQPEYLEDYHIDPFGNSRRYFASVKDGVRQLENVWKRQGVDTQVMQARAYAETLKWENSVNLFDLYFKGELK